MKLPNFSATFYRLTTFLLGLKGVHRIIGDRFTVINPSNFVGSLQYIGSLFRVDEPVPDDSRVVRPANSVENPWHGCQS